MRALPTLVLPVLAALCACASPGAPSAGMPAGGAGTAGSASPALPAPAADASASNSSSSGTGDARTLSERRAAIDGELDASLGRFDETLRAERERTARERDERVAAASVAAQGSSGIAGLPPPERDSRERAALGRDRSGDLRSEGAGASGEASGGGGTPVQGAAIDSRPRPDGSDDDIIARRLRKAAEEETDPELKERLWKEYEDYKANTRGRK